MIDPNKSQKYRTEALNSLRLKVNTVSFNNLDRSWAYSGEKQFNDPFGRIYLTVGGEGSVIHHGRMFHLRPGFLFAIPAFTPSRYFCPANMKLYSIHFTSDVLGALEPFETMGWDYVARLENPEQMETLAQELLCSYRENTDASVLTANAILFRILAVFAGTSRRNQDLPQSLIHRFQPVFIYIENNLHRNIRLKELAKILHVHPTYFSNLFTKTVGMPPVQYINRQKIRHAEALLASTDMTVQEIADKLAFSDIFYFSRVFRKVNGNSPSAYRHLASLSPGREH